MKQPILHKNKTGHTIRLHYTICQSAFQKTNVIKFAFIGGWL